MGLNVSLGAAQLVCSLAWEMPGARAAQAAGAQEALCSAKHRCCPSVGVLRCHRGDQSGG